MDAVPPTTDAAPARPRPKRRRRTALEIHTQRRRWVNWALIALSFVVLVNALVGEKGYLANLRARRQYGEVSQSVERLKAENARYEDEIRALQQDPRALEDAARRVLGLVKPGEQLVIVRDGRKNATTNPAAR